ncbi:MAG: DUF4249 domain-containing protein [Flavobacteriaceae bacterium]|nr:DUF4249 domain-containing protein [Flavobacteriaceae bacterium]
MKNPIRLLIILLLFNSCEDVINLDLPVDKQFLVIETHIDYTPELTLRNYVKLSLSTSFYQEINDPVGDAKVTLEDLTNNRNYNFTHSNNGIYILDNFTPEFNRDYRLTITYKDELYQSTTEQLIPCVPISKLEQGDGTLFSGNEKEVKVSFTDDGSRDDFYLFRFASNSFLVTEDRFYQGNTFNFSYFYDEDSAENDIIVSIFGITERYYNYMDIIISQTDDRGNPFGGTAANPRGNIKNITNPENYPLGYFQLSETYSQSLSLQ